MLSLLQRLIRLGWPIRAVNVFFGKFNPWLPEHRRDPYTAYKRLRETAPVYWSRILRGWVVSRYDDVAELLRDKRFSANRHDITIMKLARLMARGDHEFLTFVDRNLLNIDPPDHTRIRRLVNQAFTPRRIEALRPRIQALADELLDATSDNAEMEFVCQFAHPLPVTIIAEVLGVPAADRERFRSWSDGIVQIMDPLSGHDGLKPARRASGELAQYFRKMLAERRRGRQRDDLLSAMISAEEEGDRLTEGDLLALCALLLAAGHETTTNLLSNAVLALLAHPSERRRLRENPQLIRSAVEEFLRYDSPVQMTDRVTTEVLEFRGKQMAKGQLVFALFGSANRDPSRFDEPDQLNLGREDNRHLAFGHGPHYCLGATLARLEAEIALGAFLERYPDFSGDANSVVWRSSAILRGPTALRLTLTTASCRGPIP